MNIRSIFSFAALLAAALPVGSMAQDYDYHPALSDNFTASLGAMRSSNSLDLSAVGILPDADQGKDIDFDDNLGVSDSSTFLNAQLRWKFGAQKKWSVWGQYFSNNATGNATLEEEIEWNDATFLEGTYAEAGVKLAVARVFVGRSFYKNEQNDFGVGVGLHNLDLSAYIEGEVLINDETTGVRKVDVSASSPLPNIGAWYNFSPARSWLLHSRVDWISANLGDYDGGLWNANFGVNYQAFRNLGLDLSWQYFNLHVDVDRTNWVGSVNMTYSGPVLSATFNC